MKKYFILLAFLPLIGFSQDLKNLQFGGKIIIFQGNALIPDTTTPTPPVSGLVGDGVIIGDGIIVGDGVVAEALNIKLPKQYMKEEETLNDLIS